MANRSFSEIARMNTLKPEEMEEEENEELEVTDETSGVEEEEVESGTVYTEPEKQEEEPRIEHTGAVYSITAVPTEADMKRFLYSHTYKCGSGIFAIALTLAAAALVVYSIIAGGGNAVLSIVMGSIVVLLMANSFRTVTKKAKQYAQDLSENPEHRITYTFSDAGFDLSRGDEYAGHTWSDITKVVEGKTCYYIYIGRMQAFALPKEQLAQDGPMLRALLTEKVEPARLKFAKR